MSDTRPITWVDIKRRWWHRLYLLLLALSILLSLIQSSVVVLWQLQGTLGYHDLLQAIPVILGPLLVRLLYRACLWLIHGSIKPSPDVPPRLPDES